MLNTSMMNSGLSIHIKDNAKITKPIQIIYLTTSITSEIMNHPRFVFQFGNNSEATVVEHYIGLGLLWVGFGINLGLILVDFGLTLGWSRKTLG